MSAAAILAASSSCSSPCAASHELVDISAEQSIRMSLRRRRKGCSGGLAGQHRAPKAADLLLADGLTVVNGLGTAASSRCR